MLGPSYLGKGVAMISKLVGLASMGGTFANVKMLQKFLAGITGVIAWTVIGALMAGAVILFAFYGVYVGLVYAGMTSNAAVITIFFLLLLLTMFFAGMAVLKLQQLREMPYYVVRHNMPPAVHRVGGVVNAFLDGLTEPR